jgi:hypothetical protein
MVYAAEPPYEVIETSALSTAELDRIKNYARFWELIVNRELFDENDEKPRLLIDEQPLFERFLQLSDKLLIHFGRNWGIDKTELKKIVTEALNHFELNGFYYNIDKNIICDRIL